MKDRVILINPGQRITQSRATDPDNRDFFINIGLLVIGTILQRAGFTVSIIDARYEDWVDRLVREIDDRTAFIGCSVMTVQVPSALEISAKAKSISPLTPVVWGGPHPTFFYDQTAAHPSIDVAVVNECANWIANLAQRLAGGISLAGLKGIAFKNPDGGIEFTATDELDDITAIPPLDHSLYDYRRYVRSPLFTPPMDRKNVVAFPLITGLGCCYRCKFCINYILKRKYRFKPPTEIIEEIKSLQQNYGANSFVFMDEDFFINKKRVIDLFHLVEKERLDFRWRAWIRVDHIGPDYIDADTIRWLGRLGWAWSSMGAESGSRETLELIDKKIVPEQTIASARQLLNAGPEHWARYTFIIGLPGEPLNSIIKTFALAANIRLINPRTDITIAHFRPYPGSPLSEELIKAEGFKYPASLNDWNMEFSKHGFMNEENLAWIPPRVQMIINRCDAYFNLVRNSPIRPNSVTQRILNFICILRLEHGFLSFPFELFLYNVLKTIKPYLLKIKIIRRLYDENRN
jgi:radical SAM superfamily enzyme YgiQ (UPF0313 family)